MMEGSQSSKPSRRLKVDIAHPKVTEIAFAALQNLPMPLIVLSSLKTIVLANEAMGRLLGLRRDSASSQQESVIDVLQGQTLSQIGIDMLQDGVLPISKP
jgi:PAS domain-containing protein